MIDYTDASVQTITINDTDYQYIDYPSDVQRSSVAGLIIPITSDVREKLLDVGGFYRDMLAPLRKDDTIKRIIILSVTEKGMEKITGFHFDNGNDEALQTSWTKEPNIAHYYAKHVDKKNISFEPINSLVFIKENPHEKFTNMLDHYYSPTRVDDTGIYIGDTMLHYGETVTIQPIEKLIKRYPHLEKSTFGQLSIDKCNLTINEKGPSLMGSIGSGPIYTKDGRIVSSLEDYYYRYIKKEDDNVFDTFESFKTAEEIDIIHGHAQRANRTLSQGHRNPENVMQKCFDDIERDWVDVNNPSTEIIGLGLLLGAIEQGVVTRTTKNQ